MCVKQNKQIYIFDEGIKKRRKRRKRKQGKENGGNHVSEGAKGGERRSEEAKGRENCEKVEVQGTR